MKIKKWTIGVFVMIGLLVGGLFGGMFLAGQPGAAAADSAAQTTDVCVDDDSADTAGTEDIDNIEEEVECGPQDENEADEAHEGQETEDGNEAADAGDEVAPSDIGITAVQAQAIAEAANPNTATLNVEFDSEGGNDIWEVELDNGQDVKVDANSGEILLTEARD